MSSSDSHFSDSPFPSSLSPVPSSSPSSSRVSFLCEKELGKLLRELHVKPVAPTRTTPIPEDLDRRLEKVVDGLPMLRVRDTDDGESVAHLRAVIENLIQRLIEHDPNNSTKYQQLLNKIKPSLESGVHSTTQHQPQLEYSGRDISSGNADFMFYDLGPDEHRCLEAFFFLPEGFALNKAEIFRWCWHEPREEDDIVLHRLVERGFITRISSTSTIWFSNYFKMQGSVYSWLKHDFHVSHTCSYCQHGFLFSMGMFEQIVVNINNKILNSYTAFNLIHQKAKLAEFLMLHLGNWRRQSDDRYNNYKTLNQDDYIVVNEDFLNEVFSEEMQDVVYLSLRGTSGIVHFPDSVSNLNHLFYLDLSACNNLESLPKEIQSLECLRYLDLSECYLLEHIPIEITSLLYLRVLKGFIIDSNPHVPQTSTRRRWYKKKVAAPASSSSSCPFSALSHLHQLVKLTIRTKRMDFPTSQDLHTLCSLLKLHTLEITWVGNPDAAQIDCNLQNFPNTVQKLVLQRAPHQTASQLLELIGKQKQDSNLKKLYIRGGWLQEFNPEKHCFHTVRILRLRYLPHLEGKWDQFIVSFPYLNCLEVFQCPNLTSFPCDSSGIWQMKQIKTGWF